MLLTVIKSAIKAHLFMICVGNCVVRKLLPKRMQGFLLKCQYCKRHGLVSLNIIFESTNYTPTFKKYFPELFDFFMLLEMDEIKSLKSSGDNHKLGGQRFLSDTDTFPINSSDTKRHSLLVPVIDSEICRKPERRVRKDQSIKEMTKAILMVEKETRKKLKELEALTKKLPKLKVNNANGAAVQIKEKIQNPGSLITQKLLEETCLQGLFFKDIEPVKTIYVNEKFNWLSNK